MEDNFDNEVIEQTSIEDECHKENECPTTVHETVCVKAKVTITPDVKVHDIKYFCGNDPIIWNCEGTENCTDSCTFEVGQNICVEIPLTFSANARVDPLGIVCGTPEGGKCHKKKPCEPKAPIWDSELKRDMILNLIGGYVIAKIEKFFKSKGFLD